MAYIVPPYHCKCGAIESMQPDGTCRKCGKFLFSPMTTNQDPADLSQPHALKHVETYTTGDSHTAPVTKKHISFEEWWNKYCKSNIVIWETGTINIEDCEAAWNARGMEIAELIALNMQMREDLNEAKEVIYELKDDIRDLESLPMPSEAIGKGLSELIKVRDELAKERAARVEAVAGLKSCEWKKIDPCLEGEDSYLGLVIDENLFEKALSALIALNEKGDK